MKLAQLTQVLGMEVLAGKLTAVNPISICVDLIHDFGYIQNNHIPILPYTSSHMMRVMVVRQLLKRGIGRVANLKGGLQYHGADTDPMIMSFRLHRYPRTDTQPRN